MCQSALLDLDHGVLSHDVFTDNSSVRRQTPSARLASPSPWHGGDRWALGCDSKTWRAGRVSGVCHFTIQLFSFLPLLLPQRLFSWTAPSAQWNVRYTGSTGLGHTAKGPLPWRGDASTSREADRESLHAVPGLVISLTWRCVFLWLICKATGAIWSVLGVVGLVLAPVREDRLHQPAWVIPSPWHGGERWALASDSKTWRAGRLSGVCHFTIQMFSFLLLLLLPHRLFSWTAPSARWIVRYTGSPGLGHTGKGPLPWRGDVSTSREADLWSLHAFFWSSHFTDLNIYILVANLPGDWRYMVNARTGWLSVRTCARGQTQSAVCHFTIQLFFFFFFPEGSSAGQLRVLDERCGTQGRQNTQEKDHFHCVVIRCPPRERQIGNRSMLSPVQSFHWLEDLHFCD